MTVNPPTIEELVNKALDAGAIDDEFARELRASTDLDEALDNLFTYLLLAEHDPKALFLEWGITQAE